MKTINIGTETLAEVIPDGVTIQDILCQKLNTRNEEVKEDAFYIADLSDIVRKYETWKTSLPRVEPFFAVKCNDDPMVVRTLANLGTGFDCASRAEIKKVLDMGVSESRIIYANPCKQTSHIKFASQKGVEMMTFDNEDELFKVKRAYPNAKLVLRILPGEFKSQCNLGIKFGCHPQHALKLLKTAKELDLDVIGISFHVGSGCMDPDAFPAAIAMAGIAFDQALSVGFKPHLLDIGGGFPGTQDWPVSFEEICDEVNVALDEHFPASSGVRIIAEPGRYFVASAFTLAVNIIAKRAVARDAQETTDPIYEAPHEDIETDTICNTIAPTKNDEPAYMYYVNDGVYGSFNCLLYDHQEVTPSLLDDRSNEIEYSSSIWGPTCDGLDCIKSLCSLPELEVGDWIIFENMGAYTLSASSNFNGISRPTGDYVIEETLSDLVVAPPIMENVPIKRTIPRKPKQSILRVPDLSLLNFIEINNGDDLEVCLFESELPNM